VDTSFGSGNGYIVTIPNQFGVSYDNCAGTSIQIDTTISPNKIVVCGFVRRTIGGNLLFIALARYNLSGSLDTSFNSTGLLAFNTSSLDKIGRSLVITNSGEYIVAGTENSSNFIVAKFDTSGSNLWINVVTNFVSGSVDGADTVKIQQNTGFIIVGGSSYFSSSIYFALCRIDSTTGLLDPGFGNSGKVYTDLSSLPTPVNLMGNTLGIQTDGKIIFGGTYIIPSTGEESFALARYDGITGSLDLSFGLNGNGLILEDLVPGIMKEKGLSLSIQPDGKVLLGGVIGDFGDVQEKKFILARYFGFPPFPPPVPPIPIPIAPICFPAGTPVLTDQGYIPIEQIDPEVNTIRNRTIVAITKTITNHDKIVCFERHSLGYNVPNQRTLVSLNHGIIYNKKLIPAKKFVGWKKGVYLNKYNGEYLYNVLMEKHMGMLVNGMKVETLDPRNMIAKLYTNNYSPEQKIKIILKINKYANDNYNKYANFNNYERLQYNRTRRLYEVHRFNPIIGKLHLRTQKNYSFLHNITNNTIQKPQIYNQTIRHRVPLIKNNSMIKINTNALHRFTRYGRRRR
jgi:uncharacterized delta-60 repeat protein